MVFQKIKKSRGMIQVGPKKLGIEFAFSFLSFWFIVPYHFWCSDNNSTENIIFGALSVYIALVYISLALCNPGRLNDKQKKMINEKVSHSFVTQVV